MIWNRYDRKITVGFVSNGRRLGVHVQLWIGNSYSKSVWHKLGSMRSVRLYCWIITSFWWSVALARLRCCRCCFSGCTCAFIFFFPCSCYFFVAIALIIFLLWLPQSRIWSYALQSALGFNWLHHVPCAIDWTCFNSFNLFHFLENFVPKNVNGNPLLDCPNRIKSTRSIALYLKYRIVAVVVSQNLN